jgi:hypothetical protein
MPHIVADIAVYAAEVFTVGGRIGEAFTGAVATQ